jgi:spore coat protein CotF
MSREIPRIRICVNMKLNQKETQLITELKTQEELCMQKYDFYSAQAKDPELKKLFKKILKHEQNHYDMLNDLMKGNMPAIKTRKPSSVKYEPTATHKGDQASKDFDKFLCTDIIATEKYVATTYNNDLFYFVSPEVRNVLNAIMTDEQNHAEMIWKYKVANKMTA